MKEQVTLTIDEEVLEDLKNEADKEERSISQMTNIILRKYFEGKKR